VLVNTNGTIERQAITLDLDPGTVSHTVLLDFWSRTLRTLERVVVDDEDIDIYDINDVWWAIQTRVDPVRDVQAFDRGWSGPLDQAIHPDERGTNSRLIIDATRPWEWRDRFAEQVTDAERGRSILERWGHLLDPGDRRP